MNQNLTPEEKTKRRVEKIRKRREALVKAIRKDQKMLEQIIRGKKPVD